MLTDRADIHAADTNEELLNFDISDDELERAAPIIGGVASRILLLASSAIAAAPSENSPSEMASLRRSPNWIKVKNPNAPGTESSTRRPVCCIAATILTFQSMENWKKPGPQTNPQGVVKHDWLPTGRIDFTTRFEDVGDQNKDKPGEFKLL